MEIKNGIQEIVKNYYGEVLDTNLDLKTNACCLDGAMPAHILPLLKNIHEQVNEKFYGCGSPIPPVLEGMTVLDLGCGSGRDCYILSQLVGENGRVIGVDMTENQLNIAKKYIQYHMDKFDFQHANVAFKKGYIEDLSPLGIADNSIDVVISNCVLNLSDDKKKVFQEIFRILKPGGELFFSDVFSGRRIPEKLQKDPILVGECLGGALYIEDFRRVLNEVGCLDYRVFSKSDLSIEDTLVYSKVGMIDFYSMTIRAFKCDLEDICEDYGHVAYYKGTISEFPHAFILDDHHLFPKGKRMPVCGNTAKMLMHTRFSNHFKVTGDFSVHFGPFDCVNGNQTKSDSVSNCC